MPRSPPGRASRLIEHKQAFSADLTLYIELTSFHTGYTVSSGATPDQCRNAPAKVPDSKHQAVTSLTLWLHAQGRARTVVLLREKVCGLNQNGETRSVMAMSQGPQVLTT